jgi:hypothetical protein
MTPSEELVLVDQALQAIYDGNVSSYSIGGRSVSKLALNDLINRKRELEMIIARENGGMFYLAKLQKPRP